MRILSKHSLAVVSVSAIAALLTSSCDISCEGGSWENLPQVSCDAPTGGASLVSPAAYGLPASAVVTYGRSCLDTGGGCTNQPTVRLETAAGPSGRAFNLEIDLPAAEGPATHTLPVMRPDPYVGVGAYIADGSLGATSLRLVSGTVTVETSSASELRLSFELELELPSTMERFSITGGTAAVSGCAVHPSRVCVGGD
jgi:hypothetical protein